MQAKEKIVFVWEAGRNVYFFSIWVAVQKIGKLLDSVDPNVQKRLVEKTGLMDWAVSNKHLPLANFCQHVMLGENEDAESLLQHVLQYADEDNLGWLWSKYTF